MINFQGLLLSLNRRGSCVWYESEGNQYAAVVYKSLLV